MHMSRQVRDVFALSLLIAGYGLLLWAYESKLAATWGENFASDPRAIFGRADRDRMIAEEMEAAPVTEETAEGSTDGAD